MRTTSGVHRFDELDSLRGIAAFAVVLFHGMLLWHLPERPSFAAWRNTPLGIIADGSSAVDLFFMMSGFVLFLPYKRDRGPDSYRVYLIKRVCRIYLPYLPALALSVLADTLLFHPIPGLLPFSHTWATHPLPWRTLAASVLFIGIYPYFEFNLAFWTLVQEMRVSLVYPLIARIVRRLNLWSAWALGFGLIAIYSLFAEKHPSDLWQTLYTFSEFIIGAALASHLAPVRRWIEARGLQGRLLLLAILLTGLSGIHYVPHVFRPMRWMLLARAAGVLALLLLALTSRRAKMTLHLKPLLWLGRVSYSLYLLHGTVYLALIALLWGRIPGAVLFSLAVAISLGGAEIFHRLFEKPSMELGRQLAKRVTPANGS